MTGFQPKLGRQSHWWIFIILAATLLLPVVASWIVSEYLYTETLTYCDRIFWDVGVVTNSWSFSFRFFGETLLSNPLMFPVLFFSLLFAVFVFRQKFYLLRPRDFPLIPLFIFFLLIAFSGFVYWESLDIFTKGRIEQLLGDTEERRSLLERNLDRLRTALDDDGTAVDIQQLRNTADSIRFTGIMQDRMGIISAGALFSEVNSTSALFEGCQEKINVSVPIDNADDGFSTDKSVNVKVFMPIEYERIVAKHWSPDRKLKYFHEVLGVGYLFGFLWWIYLLLLILPAWVFFSVFGLYRLRVLKIRATTQPGSE